MKRYKCFMVMVAMVALMLQCNANEAVQTAAKTAAENESVAAAYDVFGMILVLFWGGASQSRLAKIAAY